MLRLNSLERRLPCSQPLRYVFNHGIQFVNLIQIMTESTVRFVYAVGSRYGVACQVVFFFVFFFFSMMVVSHEIICVHSSYVNQTIGNGQPGTQIDACLLFSRAKIQCRYMNWRI